MVTRKIPPRRSDSVMRKKFEDLHKAGAERFGYAWMRANQLAVGAAVDLGIDPTDLRMKTLLSLVTSRILLQYSLVEPNEIARVPDTEQGSRTKSRKAMR